MKENVESGIRFKVVLIYLVVAAVCGAMILYVYTMRQNIGSQREEIEQYYDILNLTNELVFAVNQAQSEANIYVTTKTPSNLNRFRRKIVEVERMVDSLQVLRGKETRDTLLMQVSVLLREKGRIVSGLNQQFVNENPVDTLSQRLHSLDSTMIADPVVVTTIIKDSVFQTTPQKGFWKRLGSVFSPEKSRDTVVTVTTQVVDSVKLVQEAKAEILSEMSEIAEQASISYTSRISAIEEQVTNLMRTDQKISAQIAALLNALTQQTMASTLEGVERSEQLIHENYTFSVIGGSVAMALILLFVILIISDANKGKAARRSLRKIMDTRHQLFLSVSHDIKSPVNSICGNVATWKEDRRVPLSEAESVEHSAAHILALMNNLLEFSNLEQGMLTVSESDFNLSELGHDVATMFEPLARRKGLDFRYTCHHIDADTMVRGDVLKIKQVVINILSNAVKYTVKGSISFRMDYLQGSGREMILFSVTDTGAGIPKDKMDDVFKPFRRVDANNDLATGSGLGMYVVKGIVDLLGGGLHVNSTVGTGTTIDVTLPIHPAKGVKPLTAVHNIVVIDDDPALLVVVSDLFSQLGYAVRPCHTPDEVVAALKEMKTDLVVTDMEMGSTTGLDILQLARKADPTIRVVIMTGRGDYSADTASTDGFDGYLSKPVSRPMLARLLGVTVQSSGDFESLEELFDGDQEAITEVLSIFAASTRDNVDILRMALTDDDFARAQAVCHKMLPMFEQVGVVACLDTLRWMDSLRGQTGEEHPGWQDRIAEVLDETEKTLDRIAKR